jgi:peptide/nickel transport system substrate-binding protein
MVKAGSAVKMAAATLVVAGSMLAAGCGSSSSSNSKSSSGGGGELRMGTLDQFMNPNPFNVFHVIDYSVMMLEYPYLVQYDTSGKVVPDFATSWSHTADGKSWTFHLVPNAKWSDGQPMTSADVAWTLNTIIKYQNGAAAVLRENVSNMTSASAPDPATVILHYKVPTATVLSFMNNTEILPEHVWASHAGGKGGANLKSFKNSFPDVAGGPFIPEQWNGSTFLVLKRNPNYYGPKPGVAQVGIQYYTTPDSLLQGLKTNQIDYANGIPQSNAALVRSYGLAVNEYKAVNYLALYLNAAPKAPHPELASPLVRQAIDTAIDRARIVSVAYPGSQPGESIVPPAISDYWDPKVTPVYDPAKANKLLDQAGFKMGAGGVRMANGHPMQYTVIFDNVQLAGAGDRAFQIIQQNLKAIGISVTQKSLDPNAWLAADYGSNNSYNTFDMGLETNAALLDPGFNLLYFSCTDLGSYNWSGFCNKQYEGLYKKQSQIIDPTQRKPVVDQLQELSQKLVPAAIILYTQTVDAHQKGWTGFGANPNGSINYFSKLTFTSIHKG